MLNDSIIEFEIVIEIAIVFVFLHHANRKRDIRALTKEQLETFLFLMEIKPFVVIKFMNGLWQKRAHSFEDMTNVSKETRAMLEANFVINHIKVDTMQRSEDGTVKMPFVCMMI